jgi:hypothetical protein
MSLTKLILPCIVLGLSSSALAQSFNVDIGNQTAPYGIPTAAYGAAAAQPGTWVSVLPTVVTSPVLNDINGVATPVTLARVGGGGAYNANVFLLTGDDQSLMCDTQDIGGTGGSATWTFAHLAAGSYTLYTYAWAPDDNTYTSVVSGGAVDPAQTCGGPWTGSPHVAGVTYTVHHYNGIPANGNIAVTVATSVSFGTLNGFQLKKAVETPATGFCFGDDSGTDCPCSTAGGGTVPPGQPGNGCPNSLNPNGANLAGSGAASIAADSFVLNGTGMPNSSALYFQGTLQAGAGAGTVFGDGLRCAAGSVIRLKTVTNVAGASQYPAAGDPPISIQGVNVAGNLRHYQCWYRNADPAFCLIPSTFNLTNGVSVTWVP